MFRRRRHREQERVSRFQAGLIGAILVVLLCYGVYTKFANPFAGQFTLHATFSGVNGLNINSPVREAGVDVGKVTSISHLGSNGAAEVTMAVNGNGLPIHDDATFQIRPRIFLEGNFFIDLHPGTPESPRVSSGHTFPIQAGSESIQLDQLLTSLQLNTRKSLQTLIQQYGLAVKEGGPAYNASSQYWLPAYKYTSEVTHDFLGTQPGDLQTFIGKGATVSAAFDRYPVDLQNLISYLDTTASAFAKERGALAQAVSELPGTLSAATPAFDSLNVALPHLDRLATALEPGVKNAGPAIDASLPFITQLRDLVQPSELRGLAHDLAGTVPSLAKLTQATIPLMKNGVRPAASCVVNEIYPWSQLTLNDGVFSGTPGFPLRKVYQEAVDYLPGLAGESRTFDANGPYIRVFLTGGSLTYSLSPGMFGQSLSGIDSVQPQEPAGGREPPLEPSVPCETQQAITTLNSPPGAPIQQVQSNLDAPGAALRWTSAVEAAIGELTKEANLEGVKVTLSQTLTNDLATLTKDLKIK
jgi:ABC-type transporter Mla subunit MlaD